MNNTDIQAIRQAAERVINTIASLLRMNQEARNNMNDDAIVLARFALAQIERGERELLDGRLPVTDHWLKSIGFDEVFNSEVPDYQMLDERSEIKMSLYQCENVFVCAEPEWPYDIAARQQVLDLMKCLDLKPSALGITPKGDTPPTETKGQP